MRSYLHFEASSYFQLRKTLIRVCKVAYQKRGKIVSARERRLRRAIVELASPDRILWEAPSPDISDADRPNLDKIWGLHGVWDPYVDASSLTQKDTAELLSPRGYEFLNPEFVLDWLTKPEKERNATDAETEKYGSYREYQERKIFRRRRLLSCRYTYAAQMC